MQTKSIEHIHYTEAHTHCTYTKTCVLTAFKTNTRSLPKVLRPILTFVSLRLEQEICTFDSVFVLVVFAEVASPCSRVFMQSRNFLLIKHTQTQADEVRPPTSAGMLDSCVSMTARLPLSPLYLPSLSHTCSNITWSKEEEKKIPYLHSFLHTCPHMHTDHLPIQRHIEFFFLCSDTQAPASPLLLPPQPW